MRVISGKYKGRKLDGFAIEGTRPTMDRVKESIFAMLQPYVVKREVLDLFGGSGALGIEALSLGASSCLFVDSNPVACATILKNTKNMENITICKMDFLTFLKQTEKTFDMIILDPPYQNHFIAPSIAIIEKRGLLKKEGLLLCEYETENFTTSYSLWKEKKYGSKMVRIYKNN